ncbi:MAG: CDP-alcohol phosphatidyltransferase family protein [Bacteroidales bacterium]|nr:CDP-alcohol phosphatidyltransferase family protein [Bacteroidales bacterium]
MRKIFEGYSQTLKQTEVEEVADLVFYRPLGYLIVLIVKRWPVTPNHLTFIALGFGAISGYFYSLGTSYAFILAAVFLLLFNIFDCSDGQLARLKRNGTAFGRIIDGVADYITGIFTYVGIGIGFANHTSDPLLWWTLLIITAITNIFHSMMTDHRRSRFLEGSTGTANTAPEETQRLRDLIASQEFQSFSAPNRIITKIYYRYNVLLAKMAGKHSVKTKNQGAYYAANKRIMKFWTFLGPTTQITFLVICSFFGDFYTFILGTIIVFNIYAIILAIWQHQINRKLS